MPSREPCRSPVALSQLRPGQRGVVCGSALDPADASFLEAMGLCCNADIRLCRAGAPCIVAVTTGGAGTCRIGLSRPLAERIMVTPAP
ncbi:MAG: ferrous iron transport protein A [Phycisphaerae bacterium]|nr:ferrous iron transport protein A [Phycisphaerae bacterium]